MAVIKDLPVEVLLLIAQHIQTAQDFLSLCSTCHSFQDADDLKYAPSFWSRLAKTTFRVPNRPVVDADGQRWCHLYRRMLRETKVYVWGHNDNGSLGQPFAYFTNRAAMNRVRQRVPTQDDAAWPQELVMPKEAGAIADLQCGGWDTVALSASGRLFVAGMLQPGWVQRARGELMELMPPEGHLGDPFRQLSVGRKHAMALGDSGQLYSFDGSSFDGSSDSEGIAVDLGDYINNPVVEKCVAGWAHSSAYIPQVGIVIWSPVHILHENDVPSLIQPEPETICFVSRTARATSEAMSSQTRNAVASGDYGTVVNWILLEHHVVWLTDRGRLFAAVIPEELNSMTLEPTELTDFANTESPQSPILDIQGSFRFFAVMKRNGEVLIWNPDAWASILPFENEHPPQGPPPAAFRKIPALQHTGVIQVAFGDWHLHALHADGTISSYGKEMQFCGSLGLGDLGIDRVRGIKAEGFGGDGNLLPQCNTNGRRVHFETEKQEWMNHIRTGGKNKRECEQRMDAMQDDEVRAEVSEWFEDRLRKWEHVVSKQESNNDPNDDGLPAYFALSVAAAGWHSGALVLKNEEKAERVRQHYQQELQHSQQGQSPTDQGTPHSLFTRARSSMIGLSRNFLGLPATGPHPQQTDSEPSWKWENDTFPRLKLKSGEVMPGEVDVENWVFPEWKSIEDVKLPAKPDEE